MVGSLLFALLLAADLHYTSSFGVVASGRLHRQQVALGAQPHHVPGAVRGGHSGRIAFDQVRTSSSAGYRQVIAGAVLMGVIATLWYLIAVWTGSPTGRASDLYQPVAFLWFTAAVAALECGAWMWWRHSVRRPGNAPRFFSAEYLAGLTGGIFLSHVLFINLVRTWLGDAGITPHLGWAGTVALTFVLTIGSAAVFTAWCCARRCAGTYGTGARRAALPSGPGGARDGSIGGRRRRCRRTRAPRRCAYDRIALTPERSVEKLSSNSEMIILSS